MKQRSRTVEIRQFIVDHVERHDSDIVRFTAERFSITRQAVLHHVRAMVGAGTLTTSGNTRSRRYKLCPIEDLEFLLDVTEDLEEHVPWQERIQPHIIGSVPKNIVEIAEYGFTEMLNNVIDHSQSENVLIRFTYTPQNISFRIHDFGIGIFRKIMNALSLPDEVAAIWELTKGKVTTDPEHHSGEGVFFTSRLFDQFSLLSGSLLFLHNQPDNDWLIEDRKDPTEGTHVRMSVHLNSERSCEGVFNEFADPERYDYTFSKTHVPISLMQYGQENLVSRSQAKRLLNRFDRFKEVILDFSGVDFLGQAFADEIFRVFAKGHPDVSLVPIHTNDRVSQMISHVGSDRSVLDPSPVIKDMRHN